MEHAGQVRARDVGLAPSAWRARLTHADARLDAVWLPADASKLEIKIPWMVIGALLIGYPYFVNGAWLLGGVGTALLALAYLMR